MTISEHELFEASTSPAKQPCEFCGDRPATVDGRWCSFNHRLAGLAELAVTPGMIAERAAEIRATWSESTLLKRLGFSASPPWEPPGSAIFAGDRCL
jgi:hypothetical protein